MLNPKLEIDLVKIYHNTENILGKCQAKGIEVVGVTKSVCAFPEIVKVLLAAGIRKLADSRLQNIIKLRQAGITVEIGLLRIPMKSEAWAAVEYADTSYQSELKVIQEFNRAAQSFGKLHKIILMVEVGDLREGIMPREIDYIIKGILHLPNIKLDGLAMNVGCYGGVLPSWENTSLLVQLRESIAAKYKLDFPVVSGGSTSTLKLLAKGQLPPGINELRVGEAIFLGTGASAGGVISGTFTDALRFVAELVEIREKPSVPAGEINKDAFGNRPHYTDRGIRKRAILAVGRQDVAPEALTPLLPGLEILGASSDHLIIDVADCKQELQVGDEIEFLPDYGGLLSLMTSPYVRKVLFEHPVVEL